MKKIALMLLVIALFTPTGIGVAKVENWGNIPNGWYLNNYLDLGRTWYFDGDEGFTGKGVGVAVIDSGIEYTHEDFDQSKLHSYDCISNDTCSISTQDLDTLGHGTHVAGIIAAQHNEDSTGSSIGIYGVAPGVELYSYKVSGEDDVYNTDAIVRALENILTHNQNTEPINKIKVVNMSLNQPKKEQERLDPLFSELKNSGVLLFAGAGNLGTRNVGFNYEPGSKQLKNEDGETYQYKIFKLFPDLDYVASEPSTEFGLEYPASSIYTLAVSAHNGVEGRTQFDDDIPGIDNDHEAYSQTGPGIDFAALGSNVTSLIPSNIDNRDGNVDGYEEKSGTSMATPFAAGMAALLYEQFPEATPDEIESKLKSHLRKKNGLVYDYDLENDYYSDVYNHEFGFGLLSGIDPIRVQDIRDIESVSTRMLYEITNGIQSYHTYPSISSEPYTVQQSEPVIYKTTYFYDDWIKLDNNKWFIPSPEEIGATFTVFNESPVYPTNQAVIGPGVEYIQPGTYKAYKEVGGSIYGMYQLETEYGPMWLEASNGTLGGEISIPQNEQMQVNLRIKPVFDYPSQFAPRTNDDLMPSVDPVQFVDKISDGENAWYKLGDGRGWVIGDKNKVFDMKTMETPIDMITTQNHTLFQYPFDSYKITNYGQIAPQTVHVKGYWSDGQERWYLISSWAGDVWFRGNYQEF